jgi:probable phosphoglycerate mutase
MLLYIIRHGDPDYATDSLTEKGIKQADALAKRLAVNGIDEIYSSPLGRAKLTAKPIADKLGLPVRIEDWMSEDNAWKYLTAENEKGEKNWVFGCQQSNLLKYGDALRPDWYNHKEFATCPNAQEGYKKISDASDEFLARLGYKRDGAIYKITNPSEKRIAAFCHHGFGTTWLSHLLSVPPLVFWASFNLSHSGVCILSFPNYEDGDTCPECMVMSDLSHIYEAGLPMEYNNWAKI